MTMFLLSSFLHFFGFSFVLFCLFGILVFYSNVAWTDFIIYFYHVTLDSDESVSPNIQGNFYLKDVVLWKIWCGFIDIHVNGKAGRINLNILTISLYILFYFFFLFLF